MASSRSQGAESYVRITRAELFGGPDPPFPDAPHAVLWLEEESTRGRTEAGDYEQKRLAMVALAESLAKQVEELSHGFAVGLDLEIKMNAHLVAYPGPDGWTRHVLATTPRLLRLSEASRYLAAYVNCLEATAAMSILTAASIRPGTIRTRKIISNPVGLTEQEIVGTLEPSEEPGITVDQLRPKDRAFLDFLVRRCSEGKVPPMPPGKRGVDVGLSRYWKGFCDSWNQHAASLAPKEGWWDINDWTSARDKYKMLLAKLKRSELRKRGLLQGG